MYLGDKIADCIDLDNKMHAELELQYIAAIYMKKGYSKCNPSKAYWITGFAYN